MLLALLAMAGAENCNNGIDRWSCNDTLGVVLLVAVIVLPIAPFLIAAEFGRRR